MRPKTFPATTYSGNSRQRLQEIREGLKQPPKSSSQGLPMGPHSEAPLDAKVLGSKDATRQQQMRATPKFGPYQKALREIRYSLLPFANESGTPAVAEVNRQMLQELVNAGCDQRDFTVSPAVGSEILHQRRPLCPALLSPSLWPSSCASFTHAAATWSALAWPGPSTALGNIFTV